MLECKGRVGGGEEATSCKEVGGGMCRWCSGPRVAGASEEAGSPSHTAACKHMKADLHACDMCVLCSCYIIRRHQEKCSGSRRKCSRSDSNVLLRGSCCCLQSVLQQIEHMRERVRRERPRQRHRAVPAAAGSARFGSKSHARITFCNFATTQAAEGVGGKQVRVEPHLRWFVPGQEGVRGGTTGHEVHLPPPRSGACRSGTP